MSSKDFSTGKWGPERVTPLVVSLINNKKLRYFCLLLVKNHLIGTNALYFGEHNHIVVF